VIQKKLLLVGGSHADIPIILAAQKLGYWVITSGNNPNDLGHQFSNQYCPVDYSNNDKVFHLARQLNIDAICASANDFSLLSCAYTAERLKLPGYDTYETSQIIHHKDKFRKFCLLYHLAVPKAIQFVKSSNINTICEKLNFPIIVKPIDLSGGKGIMKVTSKNELTKAIAHAFSLTKSPTLVVEEYIEGTNHGYSTFIKKGKVVFAFMDDEHYFINPYLVSGASTSLLYSKDVAVKLNETLEKIASKLDLVDGLLHVQFILKDHTPYIIEICRRTPGDLYVKLVKYATGFNMAEAIIQSISNQLIKDYSINQISYITRHCVMSSKQGYIEKVVYNNFASKIFEKMVFFTSGDKIENPLTYKAEIDFIQYNNRNDMQNYINSIEKNIQIEFL